MAALTLPVGFVRVAWLAPTLTLSAATWKNNLNYITRENAARTVLVNFKPQNGVNSVTTLVQGEFYLFNVKTQFQLDDSLISLVVPAAPTVAAPAITSFSPTSGPAGTTLTITGTALANAYAVVVNNVVSPISANTATSITTSIPALATTGTIKVYTAGGVATSGTSLTVVQANQAPSVALSGNNTGTVGVLQSFQAIASDSDGTVQKVELVDAAGNVLATDTTSPYVLDWTPTATGSFPLRAKVTDDDGATSFSSEVTVNIIPLTTFDFTAAGIFGQTAYEDFVSGTYRKRNSIAVSPGVQTAASSGSITLAAPIIGVGYGGNRAKVNIFCDGQPFTTVVADSIAAKTYPLTLKTDGQQHVYTVVEGLAMYLTPATHTGTYATAFSANGAASLVPVTRKANGVFLFTDSIIIGDLSTEPARLGAHAVVRANMPTFDVANGGFCGLSITDRLNSDSLQNEVADLAVAYLSYYNIKIFALQGGANDFVGHRSVQDFQSRTALLFNKIRLRDSTIRCAIVEPYYSSYEADGNMSPAYSSYRIALEQIASQRPNYLTYLRTDTVVTADNASTYLANVSTDKLHLNDAGHNRAGTMLAAQLLALPANKEDVVVPNPYQTLSYGQVFSELPSGELGASSGNKWNTNSGSYQVVNGEGLRVNSRFNTNSTGSLYAVRTYDQHRALLRVSRVLDPRIFLVVKHKLDTLNRTGFWITSAENGDDERYDTGLSNGAAVTSFTPPIASEIPLNRTLEFWMEIEIIGTDARYRSWSGDAVTDRPNAPQAIRALPAELQGEGYVGLITTGEPTVLVKEMRIYVA